MCLHPLISATFSEEFTEKFVFLWVVGERENPLISEGGVVSAL